MDLNLLGVRELRHINLEKSWTGELMKGDQLFDSLTNIRRDFAYAGRHFVSWSIINGQPVINTLFEVTRMSLNERGLFMTMGMVTAASEDIDYITFTNRPIKVPHLDLYFWLPYFAEIRNVPTDPKQPGNRRCSVPLLFKHRHRPDTGQHEGSPYFASKDDFVAIWPNCDF